MAKTSPEGVEVRIFAFRRRAAWRSNRCLQVFMFPSNKSTAWNLAHCVLK